MSDSYNPNDFSQWDVFGRIAELERELSKWKADSRLLHGALLLLHEAGITPSSTELIAAADRAAGGGE